VNVLKNDMFFPIDLVTRGTKYRSLPGPSEEVAAAVFILIGKRMKKVTGYATQLAICKGHISGYCNIRGDINRMRFGRFQFDMTAYTFGIEYIFKTGGIFICIHMAQAAFPF
jgi:hypothetical protein